MSAVKFHITVYSHGFHVRIPFQNHRVYAGHFCKELTDFQWEWDSKLFKKVLKPTRTFAISNPSRDTFGFLREQLDEFLLYLKRYGFTDSDIEIRSVKSKPGEAIEFSLPGISPRGETQVKAIDFVLEHDHIAVLPLPTGQGKTLTTLQALVRLKERTAFVMNAKHIKTWVDTLVNKTDCKKKDILVIQGDAHVRSLVNIAKAGDLKAKFIIFSSTTLNNFLKTFIYGDDGEPYDFTPEQFYELIGVGIEVNDECHEVIHQVVRRHILLPVKRRVALSATLTPPSPLIRKIYESAFPLKHRFKEFKNNNHVVVHPYLFNLTDRKQAVRFMGSMGYSHNTLEASIIMRKNLLTQYLDLITKCFDLDYWENRKEGTKCLIFASSIEMCTIITDHLKKVKGDGIDIRRFTGLDPDSVLNEAEVIVSTPGSCGTGRDIPNLMVTICTVAISSKQLSEQVMGRLRPMIAYPDEDPRFYYFVCRDIPRHNEYDQGHRRNFASKSRKIDPIQSFVYLEAT